MAQDHFQTPPDPKKGYKNKNGPKKPSRKCLNDESKLQVLKTHFTNRSQCLQTSRIFFTFLWIFGHSLAPFWGQEGF